MQSKIRSATAMQPGKLSFASSSARRTVYVRASTVSKWRGPLECQTLTAYRLSMRDLSLFEMSPPCMLFLSEVASTSIDVGQEALNFVHRVMHSFLEMGMGACPPDTGR